MFDLSFMLFIGQHCQDKRIEKKTLTFKVVRIHFFIICIFLRSGIT